MKFLPPSTTPKQTLSDHRPGQGTAGRGPAGRGGGGPGLWAGRPRRLRPSQAAGGRRWWRLWRRGSSGAGIGCGGRRRQAPAASAVAQLLAEQSVRVSRATRRCPPLFHLLPPTPGCAAWAGTHLRAPRRLHPRGRRSPRRRRTHHDEERQEVLQPEPGRVEALHLQPDQRRVPGTHRQELG